MKHGIQAIQRVFWGVLFLTGFCSGGIAQTRVPYQHPDLVVDLGVGLWAWPMPVDWDRDGDLDLLVSCPDVPFNGTYWFENRQGPDTPFPVFEPPVRIGKGLRSPQISYWQGEPHLLTAAEEWLDFRDVGLTRPRKIHDQTNIHDSQRIRANQWKYLDYDGDGVRDLVVGVGDWSDYGWDNAFDDSGNWTNGPLHGYVYWLKNRGSNEQPDYAEPRQVLADGKPVDVFGMPSPCFEDFDGDGDLDLVCGEFLDGFTYFQNRGTRQEPEFAAGQRLKAGDRPLAMDLQMITPTAIDWDGDGDVDLICGDEDGRVAWIENLGVDTEKVPRFAQPRYFQQKAHDLKFGALVTPVSVDWDHDGDEDLICGNTAGYIGWIENLGKGPNGQPIWAKPVYLQAAGEVIRIQAGRNGSIQGPAEAKWGYTTLDVADWDHDGRLDLVVNSIWGRVIWFRNAGTPEQPSLESPRPIEVDWGADPPSKPGWNWWDPTGQELATQWRTTPVVADINGDQRNDLVMLDHEGYLAFYERQSVADGGLLKPPVRLFRDESGQPLRLNAKSAGGSGRRKLCLVDWDRDGKRDLLVNSTNVDYYRNVSDRESGWQFRNEGALGEQKLAGHTTSPTVVDWDDNGIPDLLIGAEDGFFYFLKNPQRPAADREPESRQPENTSAADSK